jgi:hypothetical protein
MEARRPRDCTILTFDAWNLVALQCARIRLVIVALAMKPGLGEWLQARSLYYFGPARLIRGEMVSA